MDPALILTLISQLNSDPSFFSRLQSHLAIHSNPQPHRIIINSNPELDVNTQSNNIVSTQQSGIVTLSKETTHFVAESVAERIVVTADQQVQDVLEVMDPFSGISEDKIKAEISERFRFFHLNGKHVPGLKKHEVMNLAACNNFLFKNGTVFRRKKHRNKKQVAIEPKDFTIEQVDSVNQGTYDIHKVTKTIQEVGYYIVPPIPLRSKIIEFYHCTKTNHAGVNALELAIGKKYWWKGMRADIINYLKICSICLDLKTKASNVERPITMQIYRPFECFSMDIAFVSKSKGFVGYLLVVEGFTKYMWAQPIKHKDAATVGNILRQLLNELSTIHGINFTKFSTRFRHDCGLEFVNATVQSILHTYGIKDSSTNPYSPSENGLAERLVGFGSLVIKGFYYFSLSIYEYNITPTMSKVGV